MTVTVCWENRNRPANTTQYTAGDSVGNTAGLWEFDLRSGSKGTASPAVSTARISGTILSARHIFTRNQTPYLDSELWLFHSAVSAGNDNAAFTPTDVELLTCIGTIDFATGDVKQGWSTAAGNAFIQVDGLNIPFVVPSTKIYAKLVARNAYVPVSGQVMHIKLVVRFEG